MFCLIRLGLTTKCCLSKQVVGFVRETFLLFLLVTFKVKPVTPPSHPQKMKSNCFESLFFLMSLCCSVVLSLCRSVSQSFCLSVSLSFCLSVVVSLSLCLSVALSVWIPMSRCLCVPLSLSFSPFVSPFILFDSLTLFPLSLFWFSNSLSIFQRLRIFFLFFFCLLALTLTLLLFSWWKY